MVYTVPETATEYVLPSAFEPSRMGYFASRSATMGTVGAAVVAATFYSFSPDLIGEVIPRHGRWQHRRRSSRLGAGSPTPRYTGCWAAGSIRPG